MGRSRNIYICQECGYESPKWLGKCPSCGEWNTFVEEIREDVGKDVNRTVIISEKIFPKKITEIRYSEKDRIKTNLKQFDLMINGGLVNGQVILIAGEPGIGKSTLMLEIARNLSKKGNVLYINSEESNEQIKMRVERLEINNENIYLYPETILESIIETILMNSFDFIIVDSIQNIFSNRFLSTPGSVTQVREVASRITEIAKYKGIPTFLVGHINKEGVIAGPKTIEHVVDTIVMVDKDNKGSYRILRVVKNRFGPTNNVAIYSLTSKGLEDVMDFSLLLKETPPLVGSILCPVLEGNRSIVIEIQTLVNETQFGYPKRTSNGLDVNRLSMIIAILDKYLKTNLSTYDIYLNVTSGFEIEETASDLAVAYSIISSLKNNEISRDFAIFGELGLGGEIRPVPFFENRITELARIGIKKVVVPKKNKPSGFDLE
ncbi:MAG: DNA repair protein RadA, partial [Candidatus Anstonellales archaeon]